MTRRRGYDWTRRAGLADLPALVGPTCALWLLIAIYQGTALLYLP